MNYLMLQHFLPHLNETFASTHSDKELSFLLTEAKPLGHATASRQPFTLLFLCETMDIMPQGIYVLRHHAMGEFGVFLVPIDRQAKGVVYQAVFN